MAERHCLFVSTVMELFNGFNIFLLYMSILCSSFVILPFVVLMHFLMPNAVLEQYWKQPYMRGAELALFTDTIYAPMRTIMLMWVIAFPRFGKRRGITDANRLVPRWYRIASGIVTVSILTAAVGAQYASPLSNSLKMVSSSA